MLSVLYIQTIAYCSILLIVSVVNMQDKTASTPDLELVGHTDTAAFAVGMCTSEPLVASGGKDTNVSKLPSPAYMVAVHAYHGLPSWTPLMPQLVSIFLVMRQ